MSQHENKHVQLRRHDVIGVYYEQNSRWYPIMNNEAQ